MDDIESLMSQYPNITFEFEHMPRRLKGLNIDNQITINSAINKEEQLQWLYEELGHVFTSDGDITNYDDRNNMQQEHEARVWGMKHQISYEELAEIPDDEYENDYEAAVDLGVQVNYLHTVGLMYGFRYKSVDW